MAARSLLNLGQRPRPCVLGSHFMGVSGQRPDPLPSLCPQGCTSPSFSCPCHQTCRLAVVQGCTLSRGTWGGGLSWHIWEGGARPTWQGGSWGQCEGGLQGQQGQDQAGKAVHGGRQVADGGPLPQGAFKGGGRKGKRVGAGAAPAGPRGFRLEQAPGWRPLPRVMFLNFKKFP